MDGRFVGSWRYGIRFNGRIPVCIWVDSVTCTFKRIGDKAELDGARSESEYIVLIVPGRFAYTTKDSSNTYIQIIMELMKGQVHFQHQKNLHARACVSLRNEEILRV
jgi:hypothetical protein